MSTFAAPHDAVVHSGRTIGKPDGPPEWHAEFGCRVGTFTTRHAEMDDVRWQKVPCLMFHVPRHLRGPYRPDELANFDPDAEYRIDQTGMRLCESSTRTRQSAHGPRECKRKASNRQPYCEAHGARLHPLDKADANINFKDPATMTRLELLEAGYIDVDDLTDDELRNGVAPKSKHIRVSKELYQKITQRHFQRAQELLSEGLLPAVQALNHIAQGNAYEPSDRIKAATYIIERVMGKTPDVLITKEIKEPWEELVAGVAVISREESRARRNAGAVDAEVVEAETISEDNDGAFDDRRPGPSEGTDATRLPVRQVDPDGGWRNVETVAVQDDSAANVDAVKAAIRKRYKMRASGRSSVDDGPILLGSKDAEAAVDVILGSPGNDQVP